MSSYRVDTNTRGLVVVLHGSEEHLIVGARCDQTLMWASWFVEGLNVGADGDGPPPWPITGLQFFGTESAVLFVFDGLPVGRIFWHFTNWAWTSLDTEGTAFNLEPIHADPEQSDSFVKERQKIASQDESVLSVLMAELDGRLRLFRDETRPMALMYGRSRSRRRGLERRSTGREAV